jgi:hypothetical protein
MKLERILLDIKADTWSPILREMLQADDEHEETFRTLCNSVRDHREEWTRGPNGLTNRKRQVGLWLKCGMDELLVAIDDDIQLKPNPYWRYMLWQMAEAHREWLEAVERDKLVDRFDEAA